MGRALLENGQFMEAESVLENVAMIKRRTLEKDDPSLAATMYNLGECYLRQSKLDEATRMLEECLEIRKKKLPASDLLVAETKHLLGACLIQQHKYYESEKMLTEALMMRSDALPPHHKDIAHSQYTLSRCLRRQYKLAEAIQLATTCLESFKQSFPPLHPYVASAVGHLGVCLMDTGRLEEAEGRFREELDIKRKSLQENHPNIAAPLYHLGDCLHGRGKDEEAQKLLLEAAKIQSFSLPQNHPYKIFTLTLQAECLTNIRDYRAAETCCFEALRIIDANDIPKNSSQRSKVMLLLRRLSPLQQSRSVVSVTPEGKAGQTSERSQAFQGSKILTNQQDDDDVESKISELTLTVGHEGGRVHQCDLSLFVPRGAVDENVTLVLRLHTNKRRFPRVNISKEEFIFSPVLSLQPHGYQFKQPVLIRYPFSAVRGGWQLVLLRADRLEAKSINDCQQIVTINTDTEEVTTEDCTFDVSRGLLGVTHACDHCWYGKPIANSIMRRKQLYCSVFGYQPNSSRHRWIIEVILHDYCKDLFEYVLKSQKRKQRSRQLFDGPNSLTIARRGAITCKVNSRSWQLDPDMPVESLLTDHFWSEWFGNEQRFQFAVELQAGQSIDTAYEINLTVCSSVDSTRLSLSPFPDKIFISQTSHTEPPQHPGMPEGKRFEPSDLQYEEDKDFIGSGAFANVFKAVVRKEGQELVVALKKPYVQGLQFTEEHMRELRKEAAILLAIPSHNHIIQIIGVCDHCCDYALVLEFVSGGDLHSLLCSCDPYLDDWRHKLDMACQIADGMKHLHRLNPPVIHRDLKPNNVLVQKTSSNYVCKIADFGLAKIRATSIQISNSANVSFIVAGTLPYVAPERYDPRGLNISSGTKLDVYSFGVILWQFRERKQPFQGDADALIRENVKAGVPFKRPISWCPDGYEKLTNDCCSLTPTARPAFADILVVLEQVWPNQ